jgi:hypothetical protein
VGQIRVEVEVKTGRMSYEKIIICV